MQAEINDVIERGINRALPVRLRDDELLDIAKKKAVAEADLEEMERDLAAETKRRKQAMAEKAAEIVKMGREVRTGEQDRVVVCTRRFVRDPDGAWVVLERNDTGAEVARDPAPPSMVERHLQRPLPGVDASPRPASVLDEARARQADDALGDVEEVDPAEAELPDDLADDDGSEAPPTTMRGRRRKGAPA
jgi:hypothetical protein